MEDDPTDDLLHPVRHDQDHGGYKVRVVAPANYQGDEYHRKRLHKTIRKKTCQLAQHYFKCELTKLGTYMVFVID